MERPAELSEKRVWLDEKDCERMNRGEYEAMRGLLGAVSYIAHADRNLAKRLESVPYGKQRMRMILGGVKALSDDLIGTMPQGQCKQLKNTMEDMEIRMVPKMAAMCRNVVFDKDLAKELIDIAQEKCHGCVEDGESCRSCGLYRVLESLLPLNDFGGMLCPFSVSEWEE